MERVDVGYHHRERSWIKRGTAFLEQLEARDGSIQFQIGTGYGLVCWVEQLQVIEGLGVSQTRRDLVLRGREGSDHEFGDDEADLAHPRDLRGERNHEEAEGAHLGEGDEEWPASFHSYRLIETTESMQGDS